MEPLIVSVTYGVGGMATPADARAIEDEVSAVPGVGGVATEIEAGRESVMIIKHKQDVELDRSLIAAAVRRAGPYTLS